MLFSSLLALVAATTAVAVPTNAVDETTPYIGPGKFHVTKFNYKCPSKSKICSWDFYVNDTPSAKNHPAINEALHCVGNSTTTEFTPGSCTDPKASKYLHINAYVQTKKKTGTQLYLQYVKVPQTANGFFWYYMGNSSVSTAASQPKSFVVNETSSVEST